MYKETKMTENSYLNPEYIKSMCTGAINDLTLDNTDLGEVETAIKNFMDNDELKGNAFSALKDSMNQYLTYITYLRDANDADIADYNSLSSAVGDEILDGATIRKNQKDAWESKCNNESIASDYRSKASATDNGIKAAFYMCVAWYHDKLAESDFETYLYWVGKEEKYDEIDNATKGLFGIGAEYRFKCIYNPNNPAKGGLYVGGSDIIYKLYVHALQYGDFKYNSNNVFDDEGAYGGNQGSPKVNVDEEMLAYLRKKTGNSKLTKEEAEEMLEKLNSEGCGYVAVTNSIFKEFEGKPDEFKKKFGFDMYDENGEINYNYLIVDFYLSTDDVYYLDETYGRTALWNDMLNYYEDNPDEFKQKYGIELFDADGNVTDEADAAIENEVNAIETETYEYETSGTTTYSRCNRCTHYATEKGITIDYDQYSINEDNPLNTDDIESYLRDGQEVVIGASDFNLYEEDGDVYTHVDGGHAMSVTGVTEEGLLIVSSWGKKYYIDPSKCDIDQMDVIDVVSD